MRRSRQLALVRVGEGLGADARPRCSMRCTPGSRPDAVVIVAGTSDAGGSRDRGGARARRRLDGPLERIDWNAITWRMPRDRPDTHASDPSQRREAPATDDDRSVRRRGLLQHAPGGRAHLQSLSRSYQRGVEDLDYEVIVVDNGSDPEQRLTPELVASFGSEFRLVEMGDERRPVADGGAQPRHRVGSGQRLGTDDRRRPRADARRARRTGCWPCAPTSLPSSPPNSGTWAPVSRAMRSRRATTRTPRTGSSTGSQWPTDGYRLFEIGHFIGERDWFDGIVESNCLFVPRKLLEQVGCFDDAFSMPGGGYANLELFERLAHMPGVRAVEHPGRRHLPPVPRGHHHERGRRGRPP